MNNIYKGKKKINNEINKNGIKYMFLNGQKRVYFQFYWSLLKKKQLLLFTFTPTNDYSLTTIKISLFLVSFSLYFTINGFFFSDETMYKVYEDKGAFDIIYQIPQILYSTMTTSFINRFLS